jgi:hypothetical protein
MRKVYLILAVLVVALLVAIPLLAQAEAEPEQCTLFLPLVSGCDGFWYSCPRETWADCECPWCLPGEMYCVRWNPAGNMVPVE